MKPLLSQAVALTLGSALLIANPAVSAASAPRAEQAWLSQADAQARSERVSNVAYQLDFALTGKETFAGTTTLQFDLNDAGSPLTVDLNKATIKSLTVNGKSVTPQYNNWFITLAAADLKQGRNTVVVSYERAHSTNGEGWHRMVDPVDGRVYTYSHFEPAGAQQMFAVFDQPDLKATYQVNVTAPADWVVVSTTRETKVEDGAGGKRWTFPVSKKLSPYNFSLHAGPYKMWEDSSGKYPMRLFARQSVAAQIEAPEWFKYTKQGLAFFDEYFGIPYQFEKYDQLLVPDFLYGAMENAGAVTFAENRFLHKDRMTADQRHTLAAVIMHEMAHQWFGDLVTMKWWNGLWLNESFASFMGTLGTAEATEFKNAWQYFYSTGKTGAYKQDESFATHPIEVPVATTANAFDNIDAITYSKGASTLKQLRHLLGEETFRRGVHDYLVKYQYRNAKLEDFIGSLGEAAGRDLSQWTREWLYQPGVNTVTARYTCKGGKIDAFSLAQSAGADYPVLREQRVQVALFRKQGKALALDRKAAVTYKGASTGVPELVGAACPDLVYPNYEDWGYAKVQLDQRSSATARADVSKVGEPLLRAMLWQSMWEGVRDGGLPLNEFMQTALNNAAREEDYALLGSVLEKVLNGMAYLQKMAPAGAYTSKTAQALEAMAWQGVQHGKDENFRRLWLGTYVAIASTQPALDRLAGLLEGRGVPQGVAVNQDVRWAIVQRVSARAHRDAGKLLAAEEARDNSDAGQAAALAAKVARPDPAVKAEWLGTITDLQTKLPFSRIRTAMENLYPAAQTLLNEETAVKRLAQLPQLDKVAGHVYMRTYATMMIPATCTPQSVQRLTDAAAQLKDLSARTRRALLETEQEDARCVGIRKAMTVPLG
ncbi:aminopeptidase N [Pseudoduganella flava]|uniref:Aminopeptidase N n=1 Tax=Pseudoduganella flava TaxID=871742 RepID=A0A562PLD6_9BURK|nr:aminopeptidase N [Pseudoduganella flava]QGZ41014.1 aminopeptidase N [Pseudoduganella flava]TWI45292.1 aminopeptidase N [Pseudoduganella flava]